MSPTDKILVIGAGELGLEVLRSLSQHPKSDQASLSVLLRPSSTTSTQPEKIQQRQLLHSLNVQPVPGNIVEDSEEALASTFASFDSIIGCTGFVAGSGTQLKITRAVLRAQVARYIPWQFGVDYDVIGRGSGQDLFDEQLDVRDLLRGQTRTRWAIISTGMFTSFLFEPAVGIVDVNKATVCAWGGWDNKVTVTAPDDIGKITAEVVLGDDRDRLFDDKPIFVAGDTVSYGELADLVEKVTGKPFTRSVLTVEGARAALAEDPTNALYKYTIVFGGGRGVAWDVSTTWNSQAGIRAATVEEWARKYLK